MILNSRHGSTKMGWVWSYASLKVADWHL